MNERASAGYTSLWSDLRGVAFSQGWLDADGIRTRYLQDMAVRRVNMITEPQYRAIAAPTLVVWTSHDPTATPEEGAQIADMIPGSRFIVMNRCGHWPQYEDAPLFNRVHVDFLLDRNIDGLPGVRG